MLQSFIPELSGSIAAASGILFAFSVTVVATALLAHLLPKDGGREFAHDGKLSAGKPRGAGIIFVLTFAVAALLFIPLHAEMVIYLILIVICMMTGYLDDASKKSWGEYKKGFLDLCVAAMAALTYLKYNPSTVDLAFLGITLSLPAWLFAICTVILIWTSVNVTNCTDGIDGLSGTLGAIPILTIYILDLIR